MKKIRVGIDKYAIVDDKDFLNLSKHKWYLSSHGYAKRGIRIGKRVENKVVHIFMSREIMKTLDRKIFVDHINGNRLDNRRENLRPCTQKQNCRNKKPNSGQLTKGVHRVRNKWRAVIGVDHKQIHLGYFPTSLEASVAYDKSARQYFGEFALLNNKQT